MALSPPLGLRWRSSTPFILLTVAIGLFTDLFLYGLVVPILPFILTSRLHVPSPQIQSHVSALLAAYAGASVLFSPVAGVLADRVASRRAPFLLGVAALLAATVMVGLGRALWVLVLARVLQGVSAAVVWTVGLALVMDTVGTERLGVTIGSIFSFISVGELAAPVLGGVLYKKAGNAGVFGLGGAVLVIDFTMRLLVIEKKSAARYSEDPAINDHAQRSNEGDEEGESSEPASEEQPLLLGTEKDEYEVPPNQPRWVQKFPFAYCLKDPRLLTAFLVAFVQASLLGSFDATVPTEAQELFDFGSLKAGLLFIALDIPYLILGPIAGWAVDRYGTKPAAVIGFTYVVPVLILLRLPHRGGMSQIVLYCAILALCGIGLAIIGSPSIVEASQVVQKYDKGNPGFFGANGPYAQLYGFNSMVFSAGLTVGPLLSGALRDKIGYGNMNLAVAGLALITAVLSFIYVGGTPGTLKRRTK
ncbi:Tetracycline resistance protein, TetA/multidrug resistance protein MdtG [Lasallia pustulata]|uniref:Tetracycline resistance protein, TetA/multidrug resistance protein MdtG n=1 Tax=Lasallia pustulata TaxID=136370 RepID=A0A1W5D296_9LECA|nr:Tetracycline resistance protein, TetA/multidrug resistance protein MdtG [Lasallia pustulata]